MGRFDHIPVDAPESPAGTDGPRQTFSAGSYCTQAATAHRCGDLRAALRLYGRALGEDRDHVPAWLGQVRVLLDMHQPEEAARWLEQAANVVGEVPGVLALRALAAVGGGDFDTARQWSDRAMRAGPDVAEVWLSRAAVVYASGNSAMARLNLDKAHEREPGVDTARRCAEVALDMGDLVTAERWLRRAAAGAPDSALVALRQGVYHERAGDLAQARHHLERALQLEPRLAPARLALEDLDARGPLARLKSTLRKWSRT